MSSGRHHPRTAGRRVPCRGGGAPLALLLALVALVVGAAGCGPREATGSSPAGTGSAPATTTPDPSVPPAPASGAGSAPPGQAQGGAAVGGVDPRVVLEPLVVDDRPRPDRPYRREEWRHWEDLDGDGCHARAEALISASVVPATVAPGCSVVAGEWVSPYDGVRTGEPREVQIDHLVPLEDAFTSGGWRWNAERRRLFANDPVNLVATSAASNQAKGSRSPDRWRPADRAAWCGYAMAWVRTKVTYDLTATSAERDGLGQMLETCGPGTSTDTRPGPPAGAPAPTVPATPTTVGPGEEPYHRNCAAARAAGAAPILRGEPGYRDALDGDDDGIACE